MNDTKNKVKLRIGEKNAFAKDVTKFLNQLVSSLRGLADSKEYRSVNNLTVKYSPEDEHRIALVILKELIEEEVVQNQNIRDMFNRDLVTSIENLNEIKNLEFNPIEQSVREDSSFMEESKTTHVVKAN